MGNRRIITTVDLCEPINYQDHSFPIFISENHFDEFWRGEWNCHWHEEFEFGIVLKGSVEYTVYQEHHKPESFEFHEGDGLFINSKILHSAKQTCPGSIVADFVFPVSFFGIQPLTSLYQKNILPVLQSGVAWLPLRSTEQTSCIMLENIKKLYELPESTLGYELCCIEIICKIWHSLLIYLSSHNNIEKKDITSTKEKRVRSMLSYIHSHYSENISINDIAGYAGISRSECFRSFKTILNITPIEYLSDYRLSMAAHLLVSTDRSIVDISMSCGFNDICYFGKQFKAKCGLSPGKYRKGNQ